MKTILYIGILLFGWQNLSAQVIPINHEMKNLKVGNVFIYNTRTSSVRPPTNSNTYQILRVVRHDTIDGKVYAVYQNGLKERADSSGIYWIPLPMPNRQTFTKEYLRYPLFPVPTNGFNLLNCGESFMLPSCYPENDSVYRPRFSIIDTNTDTDRSVLGFKVRNFILHSFSVTDIATVLGPWLSTYAAGFYVSRTTLCGAVIEGKYYGDSTCLVASSTPLRGEEFSSFSASLAPNPAADITTIRFILPTAQGLTVEIRDMLGREVVSPLVFDALSSGMNAIPIDVYSLPRGVYALRLRSTLGLRATTMIVKE